MFQLGWLAVESIAPSPKTTGGNLINALNGTLGTIFTSKLNQNILYYKRDIDKKFEKIIFFDSLYN